MVIIDKLRVEHLKNPIGIDELKPRFSWVLEDDTKNSMQKAYHIIASERLSFEQPLWSSGRIETDTSQAIRWEGPALQSGQRIYWKVKVWVGEEEAISETAYFEMGLLEQSDWKAKWIEPEKEIDKDAFKKAPYLRKEFQVRKGLLSARAYMTARGLYSFYINGTEGSDILFTPGYTSYYKRLQYQAYNITDLLKEGNNALGVILGDGWWRGSVGAFDFRNNFGYKLAYLGQITLNYEDGTSETIISDSGFKTSYGPILKADLKYGEIYDARIDIEGWNQPGFDDSKWDSVQETSHSLDSLNATRSVPVRRKERFKPVILNTPNGDTVLDFGQNLAGWVEMKVECSEGDMITLVHGEVLDKHGNFTLQNIGFNLEDPRGFQTVTYIVKGNETVAYHPLFSVFGFRYVLLKDHPGDVKPENFTAIAIYSDLEDSGNFTCSNDMINQLVHNSKWSQKGNFLDVPTDCPTRERAGWTGDAQLYCRTAANFMNVYPFFEKWMSDLSAEQYENGALGITVPGVDLHNVEEFERIMNREPKPPMPLVRPGEPGFVDGSAGWADASVIIPWTMYLCYGDKSILEKQYASAKAWVEYMAANAKEPNAAYKNTPAYKNITDGELDADYIWDTKFHFGEWLEADMTLGAPDDPSRLGAMDKVLVATSYYGYSTRLMSEIAGVLGKKEDEEKYRSRFEKIKRVYNKYFIQENGFILNDRQAPNVRTLAFDLADPEKRQAVGDRLYEIIKEKDYHLNTGFLSTPFILDALVDTGYSDAAFWLLEQETIPSWLYAVKKGATTIWENWQGISPEGEVHASMNHYSYGAVCNFMFTTIAGIKPDFEYPGYKHFFIKPLSGGSLTHALAEYESPYGSIKSGWDKKADGICYNFTIPTNTTAAIILPGNESAYYKVKEEFMNAEYSKGQIKFTAGSGSYSVFIPR